MSNAHQEVADKLAMAEEKLQSVLRSREQAEKALSDAETIVEERTQAMLAISSEEGSLRGTVGELRKMLAALESVPDEAGDR